MKLLIKFPTRNRPAKFLKLLKKYKKMMTGTDNHFLVSCDLDDETMNNDNVKEVLSTYDNLTVVYGNSKSKIEACNADMEGQEFDIVLLASDDMIPLVKGFDEIIKKEMAENFPDTDGIVWFYDGHQINLNTLCILGKKYYDRFGYIYHPDYKSFFCDDEFTQVGNRLGKQKFVNEVIIEHQHPVWGKTANDELYNKNLTYWGHDEKLFAERKRINFNLK